MNAKQADWYPDPTARHELRYWNGTQWTDHVADSGEQTTDPYVPESAPPAPAPPAAVPEETSSESSSSVPTAEDEGGRGRFGDGVTAPLYEFQASRIKGGRMFTPNVIRVWPDRIEEYEHHVVRKKGTQAIHYAQVAQVAMKRGLRWSDLTVESTGGHTVTLHGMQKAECERVKAMLDDAVHKAKHPAPVVIAAGNGAAGVDVADQLAKLASLRDQGVLTDEEFQAQKTKLLAL